MSAIRVQFLFISIIIFLGIWLTGFDKVHWLLYLPAVFLALAGITGICPGLIIFTKLGLKGSADIKNPPTGEAQIQVAEQAADE